VQEALKRVLRAPETWVIAACAAIVLALMAPTVVYCTGSASSCTFAFHRAGATGDQRYFQAIWEATRVALSTFHQFPSWNPYHCGGIVLYQDPQSPFPGPMFLLTFFWLPTPIAIKLWVLAHLLVGALGARALVKDRGGNGAEQILAATVMAASGFVAQHTGGGHLSFTPFLFFPYMLWSFRRALGDVRYVVVAAGLLALAAIEGGTYPVPLMAFGLVIESVARLGSASDRRGLARALPWLGVLFVLFVGVRMIPVVHYLREHPRLVPLDDQLTLGEVLSFWVTRDHARAVAGHPYVWPEYDAYVGIVPAVLMLAGVLVAIYARDEDRRARRIDLALFAGLVWAALGNIPGPSLFGLLHQLPIYASLRVPSRFLGPAMVGFGLLAVSALVAARAAAARRALQPRAARAAGVAEVVLVLAIAVDVVAINQRVMQQGIDPPLPRARAASDFFQDTAADYGRFPAFPVAGHGTRSCYTPIEWKPAAGLVDGRQAQAWAQPAAAGTVKPARWSPNAIELDVHLDTDALVVVNQNYETGWRASLAAGGSATVGAWVAAGNRFWDVRARPGELPAQGAIGLLAVQLPRGDHHLTLRHRPRGLWLGLVMTLAGIALAVWLVRRSRRPPG
jgi:hypothetical protein